jgi:hypothetical protein
MRQVMPHRNNIHVRGLKCKKFLRRGRRMRGDVTFLPHRSIPAFVLPDKILLSNKGLPATYPPSRRISLTK